MEQNTETMDVLSATNEAKKQFSRLGLAFFAGSIVLNVVSIILSLILRRWKPEWLFNANITTLLSSIILYIISMPVVALITRRMPKVNIPKRHMSAGKFLLALIMCYPIMYGSNLIGLIITGIIEMIKGSAVNNELLSAVTDMNMIVIILYMVIIAPVMEELIFRKLIVDRTARYGQGVAVVISGIMFGLFHGNLNQFVYATTLGMFFAFLYVKTGNIKITIGLHMIINFMGSALVMILMRAIKYDELVELSYNGSPQELLQFYAENLPAWIAYLLYLCLIIALVISGIVLLILFRKKLKTSPGEVSLPKGKRFDVVFGNIGMLLFCLFWIGMIIEQLLL